MRHAYNTMFTCSRSTSYTNELSIEFDALSVATNPSLIFALYIRNFITISAKAKRIYLLFNQLPPPEMYVVYFQYNYECYCLYLFSSHTCSGVIPEAITQYDISLTSHPHSSGLTYNQKDRNTNGRKKHPSQMWSDCVHSLVLQPYQSSLQRSFNLHGNKGCTNNSFIKIKCLRNA